MALCINNSGTYRNITILCVNDSGTYRKTATGCINQSGTYRKFGYLNLGDSYEGGFLICKASPIRWVVSPRSAEVSRNFYDRNDANTRAQEVSGCTGWFVPTNDQLPNPGYLCRSFWGPSPCYSSTRYYTVNDTGASNATSINFADGASHYNPKGEVRCVRAFRCVSY